MQAGTKQSVQKITKQCLRILQHQTYEAIQKWTVDSKLSALQLRHNRATEVVILANYLLQKLLIQSQQDKPHHFITLLIQYHKKNPTKSYEHAKLIKYFSEWDYQFQYIYDVALDRHLHQVGLYLRVRQYILKTDFVKTKKDMLSGVSTELESWANLAKIIFKSWEEEVVVDRFAAVVKNHYIRVKKSQAENINGAEFWKICQIMEEGREEDEMVGSELAGQREDRDSKATANIVNIFDETLLKGLSSQDKQLIRVLSYKDKNIARMLQEKHTKMVYLIGEEVAQLRKDINREKERYVEVIEQKNALVRLVERIKESSLKYIVEKSESSQFQLLRLLDNYNKKHNPRADDVAKTTELINNRRLIQIIQREEEEVD